MALLLIEDNERLAQLMRQGLERAGLTTDVAATGADARAMLGLARYDVVILDLGLPDDDGADILRTMRLDGDSTPVIIMTARGTVSDRVSGLNTGADDYLVKPVALEELIARINALLRRPGNLLGSALKAGNVVLDTISRQVFVDDKPQTFGARETMILENLLRRPERVIPKQTLEHSIYGLGEEVSSNAIEVYVHRLRRKLSTLGATPQIHTIRGVGYMISGE